MCVGACLKLGCTRLREAILKQSLAATDRLGLANDILALCQAGAPNVLARSSL